MDYNFWFFDLGHLVKRDGQRKKADDARDDAQRDERVKRIGEERGEFPKADVERIAGWVRPRAPWVEFRDRGREEELIALPECLRHR